MSKLSDKHKLAADLYLSNGFNKTQAIIDAGYTNKYAHQNTHKVFDRPEVIEYIKKEQDKTSKKLEIKREDMLRSLVNRAKLVDEMQILAAKQTLTIQEESKYARLLMMLKASDGNKAWEQIAKAQGWNEPEKQEVTHKGIEGIKIEIIKKNDKRD